MNCACVALSVQHKSTSAIRWLGYSIGQLEKLHEQQLKNDSIKIDIWCEHQLNILWKKANWFQPPSIKANVSQLNVQTIEIWMSNRKKAPRFQLPRECRFSNYLNAAHFDKQQDAARARFLCLLDLPNVKDKQKRQHNRGIKCHKRADRRGQTDNLWWFVRVDKPKPPLLMHWYRLW